MAAPNRHHPEGGRSHTFPASRQASMFGQLAERVRLVVNAVAVYQGLAGPVQAHDVDPRSIVPVFEDYLVQRADGGDIPEVCFREIDYDVLQRLLEAECVDESVGRGEEYLACHSIEARAILSIRLDRQQTPNFVCKEHRRQQYASEYAVGEVVRPYHDHDRDDHHQICGERVFAQVAQRLPTECTDRHHDHDSDQRRHRNLAYPVAEKNDHDEQRDARRECG